MDPPLQRRNVTPHIPAFWRYTDDVIHTWQDGEDARHAGGDAPVALLILFGALFDVDFMPDMERLWEPILDLLEYISPGLWIFWPDMPRPKYRHAKQAMDDYLYGLIRQPAGRAGAVRAGAGPPATCWASWWPTPA